MTKLQKRFRPIVWLVILQLTNVPIPFVHDHDAVYGESISIHLAARHQGELEPAGCHLHFFFLGPVCWACPTEPGEVPIESGGPVCPHDQQVVAEVDIDVDIRHWLPLWVERATVTDAQRPHNCCGTTCRYFCIH